jgi:hypothetical protein
MLPCLKQNVALSKIGEGANFFEINPVGERIDKHQ